MGEKEGRKINLIQIAGLVPIITEDDFTTTRHDYRGAYIVEKPHQEGELPNISVFSKTTPAGYELSLLAVKKHGIDSPTHYDNPRDPPSKEATVSIKIADPLLEPRLSRIFPGDPGDLEVYRQEVVNGIHDHWINPTEKKWTYTYHERLRNYNPSTDLNAPNRGLLLPKGTDQIELLIDDLTRDITSKGAQATTWMPTADPGLQSNRPCLQRLWFRAYEVGEDVVLNLNSDWRSRDLFRAWFMNVWAITDLHTQVARQLQSRIGRNVKVGSYFDKSDSLHIYGSCFEELEPTLRRLEEEPMEGNEIDGNEITRSRVWKSDDFDYLVKDTREKLEADPDHFAKGNH